MKFQKGDWVLSYGYVCRVAYANEEIVATRRVTDGHVAIHVPDDLAANQVPWIVDRTGHYRMPAAA